MASLLEEKDSIRELMARYCFYTDSGQSEKYAGLFTEDCEWDGGPFGRCMGRAALRAMHQGNGDSAATQLRHLNTNAVITVDGDEARAVSYVAVIGVAEQTPTLFFAGAYFDRFVKQDGQWQFKLRRIVTDLSVIQQLL
jgi:hypothetical protein